MSLKERTINVDIMTKEYTKLKYKQGEAGQNINIKLFKNGKQLDLFGLTVNAFFEKTNGEILEKSATINDNIVTITLSKQILNIAGKIKTELYITKGEELVISFPILIDVEESINASSAVEEKEEWDSIKDLLIKSNNLAMIDDNNVSTKTTSSSYKINSQLEDIKNDYNSQIKEIANNQIPEEYLQQNIDDYILNNDGGLTTKTEFNTLVESGLDSIILKNEINKYITPFITSINISEFTNTLLTPSQAYGNGYISTTNEQLREIIFHEGTTSTKISIYIFNSSDTLISQQENLDVSELKCTLTTPIELSIGDYVLVRCLDGESKYKRLSESSEKEYQPGNGNLIDSPISLAFDIKTMQLKSSIEYKFKPIDNPSLNINNFIVPKVVRLKDEGYTLLGRWFKKDSTFSECCNSAGASIMFKVKDATSVSININQIIHPNHPEYVMSDEPYFAYSIDGGNFVRVQIDSEEKNINIPSTDEHLVWIVVDGMCLNSGNANRNSGWSGVYIKLLTTDGKMYKVAIKNKQILFVGDSIVEGINTLGTDSTSSSNSCVNEFSFKTARKLNSIPLIQGYGGSTSWNGIDYTRYSIVDSKVDTFINIQEPDLIVIEYGYNDNSVISVGGKTKEYFIEQYTLLINILKGKYSGIPIICMIPFKQSLREEIINIANLYDDCYVIETNNYNITYSDTAHPNVAGAENASTELSKDILKIFGNQFFI